jgi:16S rRNA (uracil1498-N3)-methyltransferase
VKRRAALLCSFEHRLADVHARHWSRREPGTCAHRENVAFYPYDRIRYDTIFGLTRRRWVSTRFYCPNLPSGGPIRLRAGEFRHLSRVRRLGVHDLVELFDGRGHANLSEVVAKGDDWVELDVQSALPERLPPVSVILASAVPKADRFDWLVEKATELGVERLIPIVTARSVVRPRDSKLARLRSLIIEASKQCRRDRLMILDSPRSWAQLVESCSGGLKFLADPAGIGAPMWPPISPGQSVVLAIGPEGGFTSEERNLADQAGWLAVCLSVNTLRIETAALAGCAALLSRVKESNE